MSRVGSIRSRPGFTLIELLLAMGFVSALLIAIAMTVIQISNIYNRGLTLKEVSQSGRSLTTELQRSIASSAPFTIENIAVGSKYIDKTWGGRLCLGRYSYVWNYGDALASNNPNRNIYASSSESINFVRVLDPNGLYCSEAAKLVDKPSAVELLNVGDRTLAMHVFDIRSDIGANDPRTKQRLYTIDFVIGTNNQAALTADKKACKAPSEPGADLSYCSVQSFTIVSRAGNNL